MVVMIIFIIIIFFYNELLTTVLFKVNYTVLSYVLKKDASITFLLRDASLSPSYVSYVLYKVC